MSRTLLRPITLSLSEAQPDRKPYLKSSPNLPLKLKFLESALGFAINITRRPDGTVNRGLMSVFDSTTPPSSAKPINGVKTRDITVDESRNLWFRLYTPTEATSRELPVIFFLHGGGFAFMQANSKMYDEFCYRLAREVPAVVVSVNYRLAPEFRYPCQRDDCFDVLRYVDTAKIEGFPRNANLKHSFLAGDSAGANLSHHVALRANDHVFSKLELRGIMSIQPCFGGEERTETEIELPKAPFVTIELMDWIWKSFLPEGADRNHPASNVFMVDISKVKFPPTMVVVGGFDPLQDWQIRYYNWLKKSGKDAYLLEYPDAIHLFYAYPELYQSDLFIEEVKSGERSYQPVGASKGVE
ncbi:hypothetical protein Tsubulata_025096 [Turnera subulata]|uniref:Alpha/beta hydrolase fold-3 domain-containing protein n=1 Tax=Turnera subulata TaxID=218843 RepID=A0A9Q0GBU2_9ROSI|nr:hypothetical protein Tsubulata_025096 [Turnera subulata]